MAISKLLGRLLCPMIQGPGKLHRLRLAAGQTHLGDSEAFRQASMEIMSPSWSPKCHFVKA
jgi:hypothetical protein